MERPKLIIFDLNKTLINENSWRDLNLAMGLTEREDQMLVQWGREGIISDAQGQQIICSTYKKRGNPTRQNIEKVLHAYTYKTNAKEVVNALQTRGYELALISGSMDILVKQVAEELAISRYASNNIFVFDNNDTLERIETIDNDENYKLDQLQKLCSDKGILPSECMCVGDGANDVLLFEATKCGVMFADSEFENSAKYVISDLSELLEIVR